MGCVVAEAAGPGFVRFVVQRFGLFCFRNFPHLLLPPPPPDNWKEIGRINVLQKRWIFCSCMKGVFFFLHSNRHKKWIRQTQALYTLFHCKEYAMVFVPARNSAHLTRHLLNFYIIYLPSLSYRPAIWMPNLVRGRGSMLSYWCNCISYNIIQCFNDKQK